MIIIMKPGASAKNVGAVKDYIESNGLSAHLSEGTQVTIIGVVGDKTKLSQENIALFDEVDRIVPVTESYKLANLKFHPQPSSVTVGCTVIGPDSRTVMAGPCAVESNDQLMLIAEEVKKCGATILRGGAYKPRTSPYDHQGMGKHGLDLLLEARAQTGMPIVSEVMDTRDVELFVNRGIDVMQIGARNAQNFALLKEVGRTKTPVLLKRGMASTLEELLMAAEYIMSEGNEQVILCERGIRTFETATRNTFDLNAIPALHHLTHLPVAADPSHATGCARYVGPMALAACAAGADALEIEVHDDPANAWSDGPQALTCDEFDTTMEQIRAIRSAISSPRGE